MESKTIRSEIVEPNHGLDTERERAGGVCESRLVRAAGRWWRCALRKHSRRCCCPPCALTLTMSVLSDF